ncbi:unnamed protein product [Leptidea sinapis]|uniref:Uncharacterized protein n=1 Tax=Leptidea sinapis TaxID=189913 RepID=A0A5E4QUV1_9NEOP|nr:unnamed protein product [Leptidea sinapis]
MFLKIALEHILSLLSAFVDAMACYPENSHYEGFARNFYPWVFKYIPYSPILGVLTQLKERNGIKGAVSCRSGKQGSTILGGYEAAVYFLFSLIYLISRSVAVSLIASQVNSASTVPASVLYDVPSPVYCLEGDLHSRSKFVIIHHIHELRNF